MPNSKILWIIDKDHLGNPISEEGTWGGDNGCCVYRDGKPRSQTHDCQTEFPSFGGDEQTVRFRIKDDDGELYYEGRMSKVCSVENPFAPLEDFAQPNAGATSIELLGDNGQWDPI